MSNWIQITATDILEAEVGPSVTAARESLLATGQTDPLPGIITAVTNEVRGRVAAGNYTLGDGETIPAVLENAAVDIITWRLLSRLPNLRQKHWQERAEAAQQLLLDVAKGLFAIPEPETPATDFTEQSERISPSLASPNPDRIMGRTASDGI